MKRSEERILTTHTGSLPRPPELVSLYAQRERGEPVDPAALAAAGCAARRWVVPKQLAAGVDIGNDGEQGREGFFLYLRERMSGFGGGWKRPRPSDFTRYPGLARRLAEQGPSRAAVNVFATPEAIGEVRY